MASPHVAGAVLLLREAFPELTGEEILLALYFSCRDLGEPGEDNTFGMGVIDVKAAYDYLVATGIEPAPGGVENDVMILEIEESQTFCQDNFNIEFLFENGGQTTLSEFEATYELVGAQVFTGNVTWDGALNSGERAIYQLNGSGIAPGTYELTLEVKTPNGVEDPRPLNNRLTKTVIIVEENPMIPVQLTTGNICENAQVVLSADLNESSIIEWYSDESSNGLIGTGSPWTTPELTTTETFWVDAKVQKSIGPSPDELNELNSDQSSGGLVFDVFTPFTLKSVLINMEEAGFLVVKAENGRRGLVGNKIFGDLEAGLQRIDLDFDFSAGEDKRLFVKLVGPENLSVLSGEDFPYPIDGVLSIKGNDFNDNSFYHFFDWEIEYQQLCGRIPITVEVNGEGAVNADFTPSNDTVKINEQIAFTNNSNFGESYIWDFGDGTTSTEVSPTHSFSAVGTYTVILTVTSADGCTSSSTQEITVKDISTGLDDDEFDNQINIFPNPATDQLTIKFDLSIPEYFTLKMVDVRGATIKSFPAQNYFNTTLPVDISNIPAGIYYLQINGEQLQVVKKLVIMR